MVGCVIARGAEIIGEGWHRRFGGDHAEVEALRLAGAAGRRGDACTLPWSRAVTSARRPPAPGRLSPPASAASWPPWPIPFPKWPVAARPSSQAAGIEIEVGLLDDQARQLNAPYLKLLQRGRPWIIAKWAMTLDGKIATRTGQSRWISGPRSRQVVHAPARPDGCDRRRPGNGRRATTRC